MHEAVQALMATLAAFDWPQLIPLGLGAFGGGHAIAQILSVNRDIDRRLTRLESKR